MWIKIQSVYILDEVTDHQQVMLVGLVVLVALVQTGATSPGVEVEDLTGKQFEAALETEDNLAVYWCKYLLATTNEFFSVNLIYKHISCNIYCRFLQVQCHWTSSLSSKLNIGTSWVSMFIQKKCFWPAVHIVDCPALSSHWEPPSVDIFPPPRPLQFKSHEGWRCCWMVFPATECFHFNAISTFTINSQVPNPLCKTREHAKLNGGLFKTIHGLVARTVVSHNYEVYLKHCIGVPNYDTMQWPKQWYGISMHSV